VPGSVVVAALTCAGCRELCAGDEMRHQTVRHVARFHALLGLLERDVDKCDWPPEFLREHVGERTVGRPFAGLVTDAAGSRRGTVRLPQSDLCELVDKFRVREPG